MCKLTPVEEAIVINLPGKTKGVIAMQLGIEPSTLDVHLTRIRRKRAECREFLTKTDRIKKELYPRRTGE